MLPPSDALEEAGTVAAQVQHRGVGGDPRRAPAKTIPSRPHSLPPVGAGRRSHPRQEETEDDGGRRSLPRGPVRACRARLMLTAELSQDEADARTPPVRPAPVHERPLLQSPSDPTGLWAFMSTLRRPATAFRGGRRLMWVAPPAEGTEAVRSERHQTPWVTLRRSRLSPCRDLLAHPQTRDSRQLQTPPMHTPPVHGVPFAALVRRQPVVGFTAVDGAFLGVAAYRGCSRHAADGGVTAFDTVAHRAVATDQRRPGRTPERCAATVGAVAGVAVVARGARGHRRVGAPGRRGCRGRVRGADVGVVARERRARGAAGRGYRSRRRCRRCRRADAVCPPTSRGGAAGLDAVARIAVIAGQRCAGLQPVAGLQVSTPLQALPSLQTRCPRSPGGWRSPTRGGRAPVRGARVAVVAGERRRRSRTGPEPQVWRPVQGWVLPHEVPSEAKVTVQPVAGGCTR